MIWHTFFQPFIEFGFMRRALEVCLALSLSTTMLGVFLLLRRMSLMGDALSHAILPGVAAGYLLNGMSLLAMTVGGFIAGIAVALVFLRGSTTGGTDIVSRLLQRRWPFMPIGKTMIAVDAVIVVASMVVFKNIETGLYALIAIYVSGSVIDTIMGGQNTGRMVLIVSDEHTAIAKGIMEKMGRGATLLNATGAYSGAERHVVLCAVRNNEYPRLRELIRQYDPKAFLITTNVNEVLGEGFASLNAKNLT